LAEALGEKEVAALLSQTLEEEKQTPQAHGSDGTAYHAGGFGIRSDDGKGAFGP
jgi:hypothetical protein